MKSKKKVYYFTFISVDDYIQSFMISNVNFSKILCGSQNSIYRFLQECVSLWKRSLLMLHQWCGPLIDFSQKPYISIKSFICAEFICTTNRWPHHHSRPFIHVLVSTDLLPCDAFIKPILPFYDLVLSDLPVLIC